MYFTKFLKKTLKPKIIKNKVFTIENIYNKHATIANNLYNEKKG